LQQWIAGYQEKIVPDKIPPKSGQINHRNGDDDCRNERRLPPNRKFPARDWCVPFRSWFHDRSKPSNHESAFAKLLETDRLPQRAKRYEATLIATQPCVLNGGGQTCARIVTQ
jgi:hypothetical protein